MQTTNILFNENTYLDKLKSLTLMRAISFFIWEYFVIFFIFILFTWFTQNHYISTYILNDVKFYFYFSTFIQVFIISSVQNYLKMIVLQNYEEHVTKFELIVKLILEPKHNTLFFFLNSILVTTAITILRMCSNYSTNTG
jgi:hypothetical protein